MRNMPTEKKIIKKRPQKKEKTLGSQRKSAPGSNKKSFRLLPGSY